MKLACLTIACLLVIQCMLLPTSAESSLSLQWQKINGFEFRSGINGEWKIIPLLIDNTTTYVEFYFDNELIINDTAAPFSWTFNTADYTEGNHIVEVIAYNSLGQIVVATEEQNFVAFPLVLIIGAVLFCSIVFAFVLLVTWYIIKEKAQARRIARQSSGSPDNLASAAIDKNIKKTKIFLEAIFNKKERRRN